MKKRREEEKERGKKEGMNFHHLLLILILFLKSTFQFNFIPFFWNPIIYVHILHKLYIILLLQNNIEGFLLLCLFQKKKNSHYYNTYGQMGSRISYFPIFLMALGVGSDVLFFYSLFMLSFFFLNSCARDYQYYLKRLRINLVFQSSLMYFVFYYTDFYSCFLPFSFFKFYFTVVNIFNMRSSPMF